MKLIILGSGASQPPPRPCCDCRVCKEAREKSKPPYYRTGSSMIIEDLGVLFDTPEDIRFQLNREKIKKIDCVFYTHWHPDHTIGVRVFEHICWDYKTNKPERTIKVYIPEGIYEDLKAHSLSEMFDYFEKIGVIKIKRINENDKIRINDVTIQPHKLAEKNTWCYSISCKNKKALYAPCDIMRFPIKPELLVLICL